MGKLSSAIADDRQRRGWSQADLARALGVSQQSVSKWEEGIATPRGKRLQSLVTVLGNTSQTAARVREILHRDINDERQPVGQIAPPATQTEALAALAHAAQRIANAAKALADSVAVIAKQPPPGKH